MNSYKNSQELRQAKDTEELTPIDGFQQIVEMLKVADPSFRESLLKRLAARDSKLVRLLRRGLEPSF